MNLFAEFLGTALLVLLGNGVVANVSLARTKGQCALGTTPGFFIVNVGWAAAVFVAVYATAALGGPAHLNPAVSIAMVASGALATDDCVRLCLAQCTGAMLGAMLVWITYLPHWRLTDDAHLKLEAFSDAPAVRAPASNFVAEAIGTAVLMLLVLCLVRTHDDIANAGLSTYDISAQMALPVALCVLAIGVSLGGPTGYAINPARDLGPRIMHAVLPIPGKGSSDWGYAWIPVFGPIAGALLAVAIFDAALPVGG